jgi:uncharacterized protein YodC (DUF2158 family)
MDFAKGDVVHLKSGGPAMTVESVGQVHMTGEPGVWCVWFEHVGSKQVVQRDTFPPEVLKKAEEWGTSAPKTGLRVGRI